MGNPEEGMALDGGLKSSPGRGSMMLVSKLSFSPSTRRHDPSAGISRRRGAMFRRKSGVKKEQEVYNSGVIVVR